MLGGATVELLPFVHTVREGGCPVKLVDVRKYRVRHGEDPPNQAARLGGR